MGNKESQSDEKKSPHPESPIGPIGVLIVGFARTGKSALCNLIFGENRYGVAFGDETTTDSNLQQRALEECFDETNNVYLFDTVGAQVDGEKIPIVSRVDQIRDLGGFVDVVWFVCSAERGNLSEDLELFQHIATALRDNGDIKDVERRSFFVITKCDTVNSRQLTFVKNGIRKEYPEVSVFCVTQDETKVVNEVPPCARSDEHHAEPEQVVVDGSVFYKCSECEHVYTSCQANCSAPELKLEMNRKDRVQSVWKCCGCGSTWPTEFPPPSEHTELVEKSRHRPSELESLAALEKRLGKFRLTPKNSKKLKVAGSIGSIVATAVFCGAVAWSPIPFSDAALLVPAEFAMCVTIACIWGLGKNVAKTLLDLVLGLGLIVPVVGGASVAAWGAAQVFKLIPGVGTIAGGAINCAVAVSTVCAMGTIVTLAMMLISLRGVDPKKIHLYLKELVENETMLERLKKLVKGIKKRKKKGDGEIDPDEMSETEEMLEIVDELFKLVDDENEDEAEEEGKIVEEEKVLEDTIKLDDDENETELEEEGKEMEGEKVPEDSKRSRHLGNNDFDRGEGEEESAPSES